jgi:uncharacterized membrane protein YphA (DoxX/SURF4 family)
MLVSDTTKKMFVPLILRLALGAIFLYHGLDKVFGPQNNGGAGWATYQLNQRTEIPRDVAAKLDDYKHREQEALKPDGKADEDEQKKAKEAQEKVDVTVETARSTLAKAYGTAFVPQRGVEASLEASLLSSAAGQLAVAWGEVACGVALLVGLLTRLGGLLMLLVQIGAIALVTGAYGFSPTGGVGWEYNFALAAMCVAVIVAGGGTYSLDRLIWHAAAPRKAAAAAAAEPPRPVTTAGTP